MEYILKGKEKIERSVISQRRDSRMDVKRVKQILSSSSRIDVTYEGVPVWIESCDEQSGVAQVYDVSNPGESVHVNVTALEGSNRKDASDFRSVCFVLFHHTRNFLEKRRSTSPKTITIMPILANTSRYPNDCVKEASLPANQLAIPEPANHTPISNDANLTGAIALTIDRPIGDKNSSPIVWNI